MLFMFDMGGVVTTNFDMDKVYENLSVNKDEFFDICKTGEKNIWQELETGRIETSVFWQIFNQNAKNYGKKTAFTDLFRLFFHPQLNDETVEIIKNLRKKHRVICATNTIQSHWENHIERGDYQFFDQTYASNKIGFAKPDPLFYKTILLAENIEPEYAFFTDDKTENTKSAAGLGINAVQFTSAKDLYNTWEKYF